jgi:hypothetical protein
MNIGDPIIHTRCNVCGRIFAEGDKRCDCNTSLETGTMTRYVAIAVGDLETETQVTEILSWLPGRTYGDSET